MGNSSNAYNLAGNWDNNNVPNNSADIVFDGNQSNSNCNINLTALNCKSLSIINGYSGTITFSNVLNIHGDLIVDNSSKNTVTLVTDNSKGVVFRTNATINVPIDFNQISFGISMLSSGVGITITLARDLTIKHFIQLLNAPNTVNTVTLQSASSTEGINLYILGDVSVTGNGINFTGNVKWHFISENNANLNIIQSLGFSCEFNANGNYSGTLTCHNGILRWQKGNVSEVNLAFVNSCTTDTTISPTIFAAWKNISFSASNNSRTITTLSDLYCFGLIGQFASYPWTWIHQNNSRLKFRGTGMINSGLNSINLIIDVESVQNCTFYAVSAVNCQFNFNPQTNSQLTISYLGVGLNAMISGCAINYLGSNGGPAPICGSLYLTGTNTFNVKPESQKFLVFTSLSYYAVNSTPTINLESDLHIKGTFLPNGNSLIVNTNSIFRFCISGSSASWITLFGSATVSLQYTGVFNGTVHNNLEISPLLGETVTINNLIKNGALTSIIYTPLGGMVNTTGLLTVQNSIQVNTPGLTWKNVSIGVSGLTITLNAEFLINGNLTLLTTTFSGSYGWTCNNLLVTSAGSVVTLNETIKYATLLNANIIGTNANRIVFRSSDTISPINKAFWHLSVGASQSMVYTNANGIDSSAGQTIWSFGATLAESINWNQGMQPKSLGIAFMN